jgi:uncharacterized protein YkwD
MRCQIRYNRQVTVKQTMIVVFTLGVTACTVNPMTPAPTAPPTRVSVVVASATPVPTRTLVPPTASPTAIVFPSEQPAEAGEAAGQDGGVAQPTQPLPVSEADQAAPTDEPTQVLAASGGPNASVQRTAATPVPIPVIAPPQSGDAAAAEQYTIDLINAQRTSAGVPPLARNETLMGVARGRVTDMVTRGYTGHYDPVTQVSLGRTMIRAAGFNSTYVGENWYGTVNGPPSIAEIAMNWFMTDPPHFRNILNPNYTSVGVGIAFNGRQWLLVQNFAGDG